MYQRKRMAKDEIWQWRDPGLSGGESAHDVVHGRLETVIDLQPVFYAGDGMDYGGVIAAAELVSYALEGTGGMLAAEVHGQLPGSHQLGRLSFRFQML